MSNFKIRFRDHQTGRNIEIEAQQVKGSWQPDDTTESFDASEVGDGNVDIMVKSDQWFWQYNRHLGVPSESLSPEDAAALKRALESPGNANLRIFNVVGGRMQELTGLEVLQTDAAGELLELTSNLDPTGTRRPVQITPSGQIATPSGEEPETLSQIGDGLFRAASLVDDIRGNMFDGIQAPLALKEKLFDNIADARESVAPGQPLPEGLDEKQALQLRSSAATTTLELMTATTQVDSDFKAEVFEEYKAWIQDETNPLLKESMLFNLDRLKGSLPSTLRSEVNALVEAHAPTKPPYEKWFEDGNSTVNVDWSVGHGEGFLEDNVAHLESKGFEVVEQNGSHPVLEKTFERNGVETKFRITFRTQSRDMFKHVDKDDNHITIYSGHSNWGRNVRDAIKNAPEASGDGKLVMTNLCVGKGELQQMKDAFPDAHMITTYNSGYFRPGNDAEWHYAVDELFEGIANRDGYQEIADDTRDANPWTWTHSRYGIDNNFIFPTDLKIRKEALDHDHDGQADIFDRMVNFNTFDIEVDTQREFQPIENHRDSNNLVGSNVHFAAMSTNRISIYNELLSKRNGTAEVLPAGFHDAASGETGLFRFERNQENRVEMSMNADFAHMSEEATRMSSAFEYSMFKAEDDSSWPLDNRTDNLLAAMVLASQSLNSDAGYRDRTVWDEFIKAYNLPEISLSDVASARGADSHWYSGSLESVQSLRSKLSPEVLAQLESAEVGVLTSKP